MSAAARLISLAFQFSMLVGSLLLAPAAGATQTWCAAVSRSVPDGYLVLRAGPSSKYRELARLPAGDYLELSTGEFGPGVLADATLGATLCAERRGEWALVEFAVSRHTEAYTLEHHAGWVRANYLNAHQCHGE